MHRAVQSACKSTVNLNHVVVSATRSCELPSRGKGGQFIFREYHSGAFLNGAWPPVWKH